MNKAAMALAWIAMVSMSPAVLAVSSAQQDFQDAVNAKPDRANGQRLFAPCIACHGADGGGNANGKVPRIAGQLPRVIIRQLVDYKYDQRRDPQMEPVASGHLLKDAQQFADVADYAASLRPSAQAGRGSGQQLEAAREVFAARCASCHGDAGQGNELLPAPRLAGQHHAYLLRQFHDALEGRRPKLADSHEAVLKDLDRNGLESLADVLSRMSARR
jgi:cytochrome c553